MDTEINRLADAKPLTAEENSILVQKYQSGDKEALEKLLIGNSRLILKASRSMTKSTRVNLDNDLFQEGIIGLMHAAELYDVEKGLFSTYAFWWIKQRMYNFIRRNEAVHYPPRFYILLNKYKRYLESSGKNASDLDSADIKTLKDLGFTELDIKNVMEFGRNTGSYEHVKELMDNEDLLCYKVGENSDDSRSPFSYAFNVEVKDIFDREFKKYLSDREAFCLGSYYGVGGYNKTDTLDDLRVAYCKKFEGTPVTRQRVQQLVERAKDKLHKSERLKHLLSEIGDELEDI